MITKEEIIEIIHDREDFVLLIYSSNMFFEILRIFRTNFQNLVENNRNPKTTQRSSWVVTS